jgi:dTDP-4-dehydrorhamnose 3,5-epimerase
VIRGIHYSLAPDGQVKVVTCTSGVIVDVLIDIRLNSPTYLQVEYIELSEESGRVIYIPSGVGHGFIVQSDSASVAYLTSSKFAPEYEKAVYLNDPELGIIWPIPVGENIIISKVAKKKTSSKKIIIDSNENKDIVELSDENIIIPKVSKKKTTKKITIDKVKKEEIKIEDIGTEKHKEIKKEDNIIIEEDKSKVKTIKKVKSKKETNEI